MLPLFLLACSPNESNPLLPGQVWPVLEGPLCGCSVVSMDDSNF